ncbi:sensor domain-containing diguanylate cyclase [Alteribacter keqinensis]|uniref:Sensor domain-containing diguanylate cyclase n=1 Tax=Alteribacter keqinensis TaxID=2483800 RepID=A0A3M7TZ99_9BACI|nr:sensor domain-containing diguanylate cyclase [Alteribacter keqinensis]RNA70222.1 sensor domain-containing diguanylate cyclase [Alteribacter keqinensis]
MERERKQAVWAIWFIVFPVFVFFIVDHFRAFPGENVTGLLSFAVLIILVSLFPIRIKSTSLIPLHGIALAVFLQFGLIAEMAVTQLALFTALLMLRLSKKEIYRIPFNSVIFLGVSMVSAGVFYLLGGTTGSMERMTADVVIPAAGYALTFFITNHLFIYVAIKYLTKRDVSFWDEGLKWEAFSAVMIVPVGLTVAMLYNQIGFMAILIMGIPFVSVSLILRQFHNSETTNGLLKKVSSYGYQVNENLSVDKIIDLFMDHVQTIFPVDAVHVYDYNPKDGLRFRNSTESVEGRQVDKLSLKVSQTSETLHFQSYKQWQEVETQDILSDTESVISVPVMRNQECVAVITLTSGRKRVFEKRHVMILEFMANYLAVAVQNARNYEMKKKESERCALTNLYNFRYFENLLLEKFDKGTSEDQQFAIILLDLDHFKRVNDTYGHHSGNEVLCQVADVLTNTVGSAGTVARYGGEEFVVLIEDTNLSFARSLAETLRQALENQPFVVENDLSEGNESLINITASIGVAGKSEPDETAMAVLRNADRAMYTGAKQQGRNRVAQFS